MIELAKRMTSLAEVRLSAETAVEHDVSSSLLSAVEEALLSGETHYTVRPGIPELRRTIAAEIQRAGGPAPDAEDPADNVLITSGESESLFVILLSLSLGPSFGDVLAALDGPCPHSDLFRFMGLDLKNEETTDTRLIYRHHQSNLSLQTRLLNLATEADLPDILDLGADSPAKLPPTNPERTLIIGNLNGLPGLSTFRVAYLMGPKARLARCRPWKQAFSICSAAPSQRAAIVTLEKETS